MSESAPEIRLDFSANVPNVIGGAVQQVHLAIGAETAVTMVVLVDGIRVPVLSSTWNLTGPIIVADSTRQTLDEGKSKIASGLQLTGGHNGDPACIAAAWARDGIFEVTISGTYQFKGVKRYSQQGQVIIHAPVVIVPGGEVGSPDVDIRSERMSIKYGTGTLRYTCDPLTTGGEIGFLQILKGRCFRGTIEECKPDARTPGNVAQILAAQSQYLDDSAKGDSLFYWQTRAQSAGALETAIERSLLCDGYPEYNWYRIGSYSSMQTPDDKWQPLEFFTRVAYKAPLNEFTRKSYTLTKDSLDWYAGVMACVSRWEDQPQWRLRGTQRLSVSSWKSRSWEMPEWKDCSTRMHWKSA